MALLEFPYHGTSIDIYCLWPAMTRRLQNNCACSVFAQQSCLPPPRRMTHPLPRKSLAYRYLALPWRLPCGAILVIRTATQSCSIPKHSVILCNTWCSTHQVEMICNIMKLLMFAAVRCRISPSARKLRVGPRDDAPLGLAGGLNMPKGPAAGLLSTAQHSEVAELCCAGSPDNRWAGISRRQVAARDAGANGVMKRCPQRRKKNKTPHPQDKFPTDSGRSRCGSRGRSAGRCVAALGVAPRFWSCAGRAP